MTGLMMIFMLVAIIFMVQIEREAKTSEQRAQKATQQATQIKVYRFRIQCDERPTVS